MGRGGGRYAIMAWEEQCQVRMATYYIKLIYLSHLRYACSLARQIVSVVVGSCFTQQSMQAAKLSRQWYRGFFPARYIAILHRQASQFGGGRGAVTWQLTPGSNVIPSNCSIFRGTVPIFGPKFASVLLFHHSVPLFYCFFWALICHYRFSYSKKNLHALNQNKPCFLYIICST